jgi:helicase
MSPLLFRNIAGRCGRAGRQTEGDTIIFDNPVGDPGFTFDPNRGTLLRKLFVEDISLQVQSVFEVTKAGSDFSEDVVSTIASQFLAAIPENPDQDDLVSAFCGSLYWATAHDQKSKAQNVVKSVASSILDGSKGALAVAASPFKLTEFGNAAVTSGFSPSSCRAIMKLFSDASPPAEWPALIGLLIVELGQLPEQPNRSWRKEVEKPNRSCRVKTSDAAFVVEGWLSGKALLDIFVDLPGVKKSKSKVSVSEWLEGLDEPVQWDEDFDTFVDWVNTVIMSFGSWLMRSCSELSAQADGWAAKVDWDQLSDFCECGVDTTWAVKAVRDGAPAGREVLAVLGRAVFNGISTPSDPLGLRKLQSIASTPIRNTTLVEAIRACFPSNESQLQSAFEVFEWLKGNS